MGKSKTSINIEFGSLLPRLREAAGPLKMAAFVRDAVEEKLARRAEGRD